MSQSPNHNMTHLLNKAGDDAADDYSLVKQFMENTICKFLYTFAVIHY